MRSSLFIGCILYGTAAMAQADTAHWSVPGTFDLFTTDELGDLYTLHGNDLDLYDQHGSHLAHNSLNTFGPISRIDAFSSLKPMIFSRAQAQLALLDNTLSVQGPMIDLSRNDLPQAALACMGVQGCFWFFDERDLALLRLDGQLKTLANSGRLDQLLGYAPQPSYMVESDSKLYLVDPDHGVMVFDLFGTFMRTLPIIGTRTVQVRDGGVWYVRNGQLWRYDMRLMNTDEAPWPPSTDSLAVRDARIEHGRLYRLMPDGIRVDRLAP
jgi:hypothetical protein